MRCTCAAGRSGCTTRSSCAAGPAPAVARHRVPRRRRARPRPARRRVSRRAACQHEWADGSRAGARPGPARVGPVRLPAGVLRDDDARSSTQQQRFDLHRGAPILRFDHVNFHTPHMNQAFRFWRDLGFRCSEYISTDGGRREAHRRLAAAQADRPRRRADGRAAARGCTTSPSGSASRPASCAPATSSRRRPVARDRARARAPWRLERILRLPARSRRAPHRAVLVRLLHRRSPSTSRCAGRSTTRAAGRSGAPARPTAGTTSPRCSSGRDGQTCPPSPPTSTSARSAAR